jgi:hypothetical protein
MAYELEATAEWQRLYELYHAESDDELLRLASDWDDLTDGARDVLGRELKLRKLTLVKPTTSTEPERESRHKPSFDVSEILGGASRNHMFRDRGLWDGGVGGSGVQDDGTVELITLFDALNARHACDSLDEQSVAFEVRDDSIPQSGPKSFDSMPVALKFTVRKEDRERAMAILREKMGLFPLQEAAEADPPIDDGTVTIVGTFGRREQAEEIAVILREKGFWHRIVPNPEGTVENEDCFSVEVKEIDLSKAIDAVEPALNLPEV